MSEHFCLKWNNHQTTLVSVFDKLLECESLVDCTLAADGRYMKAHKVVLSACSSYLEEILRNHEDKHPILIFNDISYSELKAMLEYMYRGEVNVSQEQLNTFLKAAEALKIKGLTDQGGGGGTSDGGGQDNLKRKMGAAQSRKTQSPVLGMTPVERPTSPKRRKPARRQSRDENFPGDSNSCDTAPTPPPSQPQQVNSIAARIEEKVAKIKKESGSTPSGAEPPGGTSALSALGMLQPKTEFLEESGNVEDLTLEEEEEYGPNPGTSQGSFSSQDFNNWQLGDPTSDEVFMASQHDLNNSAGNSQERLASGNNQQVREEGTVPMCRYLKRWEATVGFQGNMFVDTIELNIPADARVIKSGDDGEEDMGSAQHYCLRWNNYQSNMTSVFHHLLRTQAFVDVTLACNDQSLKAHKVVLSACSSYFQKLLLENPCKHPTIIMPQDVCFTDLKFIIEFVYKGEIDVSQAELQSLLKTADQLKIKGLCEVEDGKEGAEVTPLPPMPRRRISHRQQRLAAKRHLYRQRLQSDAQDDTPECMDVGDDEADDDDDDDDDDEEPKELPVVVVQQSPSAPPEDVIMGPQQPSAATAAILHQQPQSVAVGHDSPQIGCEAAVREGEVTMGAEPNPPSATLVTAMQLPEATHRDIAVDSRDLGDEDNKVKFETLTAIDHTEQMKVETQITDRTVQTVDEEDDPAMHTMMITPELLGLIPSSQSDCSDVCSTSTVKSNYSTICTGLNGTNKSWTQEDMDQALQALRHQTMSLSKASATYGIPSTTLWQRAHRLGIDTPKKEGQTKSWTEHSLNTALEALRTGQISANKASKAYGIPSSTLYKIARREGIRLAAPFNAAPTAWVPEDLERALDAIRSGQCTVQRAAAEYGIPSGTLYGRCKREGIELSRNNPTPWSEEAMMDALEAVRIGQMSINQAAIHFNLPYSSLYGRFKRGKYESISGNQDVTGTPQQQPQQEQARTTAQQTPPPPPPSAATATQEIEQNDLANQQQQQQPPQPQQQHSPTNTAQQQQQPQIMLVQYQQPLHVYQPATAT